MILERLAIPYASSRWRCLLFLFGEMVCRGRRVEASSLALLSEFLIKSFNIGSLKSSSN